MTKQDWLVDNNSQCFPLKTIATSSKSSSVYRLYRFLTDLEDILENIEDDAHRLGAIAPLVRKLLNESPWLFLSMLEPDPETGWEIMTLYDEPSFPLTVQLVAWAGGTVSPIHNHGSWGIVALLEGQEKNTFWRRNPQSDIPNKIEQVGEKILSDGDILCLMPDAIHHIEAMGYKPTISLNIYGETNYDNRFEFNAIEHTAINF
jgi:predicted metal-dependent enzyme (double-stranded beta helix superfamily)